MLCTYYFYIMRQLCNRILLLLKKGKDEGKDTEKTLIELSPEADLCIVGHTELSHNFVIIQILSEIKKK